MKNPSSILNSKLKLLAMLIMVSKVFAVTVVEVFAFTCVHCYNAEASVEALANKQSVIITPVPLYDQSDINQVATINAFFAAAEIGKGWLFRKVYFNALFSLHYPAYAPETLIWTLKTCGLNNKEFYTLASSQVIISKVQNSAALAIKFNVNGTPTFIVNGQFFEGEDAVAQIINTL